jgi:hypothetical protein
LSPFLAVFDLFLAFFTHKMAYVAQYPIALLAKGNRQRIKFTLERLRLVNWYNIRRH